MNINKTEDPNQNESFSYDALGNRLTYNGITSTYDSTGQRIQDDGSYTYVYDANGNIIYKQNKSNGISYTFEYSALNQLKKATVTSTPLNGNVVKTIEYKYDPVGRRISRQVTDYEDTSKSKTQKFYYDGDNIIAELDADNNLTASYTHSPLRPDDVLGAKFTSAAITNNLAASAGYVYYLKDHLNTVSELTNAAGDIIQKMEYSAFGTIRSVKNSIGTEVGFAVAPVRSSFTYTGREYEPELGMYYYRARYYDPTLGRFLQQDPDPGRQQRPNTFLSKYIYAGNVPTINSDPTGAFFGIDDIIFLAIMAGAGALAEGGRNGFTIDNILKGALRGLILGIGILGVASLIGGISGAITGGEATVFGKTYSNWAIGLLNGIITPGANAQVASFFLALPAAVGMFDPDASDWSINYANNYLVAGTIGGLARAAVFSLYPIEDPRGWFPADAIAKVGNYTFTQANLIEVYDTMVKIRFGLWAGGFAPMMGVRR